MSSGQSCKSPASHCEIKTMTHKPASTRKPFIAIACLAAGLTASPQLLASGGGGSFNSSSRSIDQQYELGKSYYKSAQPNGDKLKYCVQSGDELKKLSRRSVKPFKNGPVMKFVESLYDCSDPNTKIADIIPDAEGDAILYYLNKRYKLRLKG